MSSRKKKYLIGGIILIVALGFLFYNLMSDSLTYYYTVGELLEQGEDKYGDNVRVSGNIVDDSIRWDPAASEFWFTITDESASLPVVYKDNAPHTFEEDKAIVVEGKYMSDGIFHADKLVMKCASKYEAEE